MQSLLLIVSHRSIRAGRGNIRPAFGNYTREQAFFTRKFFSSGRFAPAAEISGLRSETTPANKPFSPGSSFPPVDSRRPRKYPACVRKLHPRTSLFHPATNRPPSRFPSRELRFPSPFLPAVGSVFSHGQGSVPAARCDSKHRPLNNLPGIGVPART